MFEAKRRVYQEEFEQWKAYWKLERFPDDWLDSWWQNLFAAQKVSNLWQKNPVDLTDWLPEPLRPPPEEPPSPEDAWKFFEQLTIAMGGTVVNPKAN